MPLVLNFAKYDEVHQEVFPPREVDQWLKLHKEYKLIKVSKMMEIIVNVLMIPSHSNTSWAPL